MIKMIYSEAEMKHFGKQVGGLVKGGEVIELIGDVGSGKTTFVKGLAEGLGITDDVQSPSFTVSREYKVNDNLKLIHYDFYRLENPGLMVHEIHENVGNPGVVTVIEWAGIVQDILPIDRMTMSIMSPTPTTRHILIESHGVKSMALARMM